MVLNVPSAFMHFYIIMYNVKNVY